MPIVSLLLQICCCACSCQQAGRGFLLLQATAAHQREVGGFGDDASLRGDRVVCSWRGAGVTTLRGMFCMTP